jgi:hypothetical protein
MDRNTLWWVVPSSLGLRNIQYRRLSMDDFLHNLRSGKLKQPDRSSRPYSDSNYKSVQRRNIMDRRKRDYANKDSLERMEAIKEILESLSESQKRMADAYEARTRAEERKVRSLELLAQNLYRMLNPNAKNVEELFADPPSGGEPDIGNGTTMEIENSTDDAQNTNRVSAEAPGYAEKNNSEGHANQVKENNWQGLINLISKLREQGNSWEFIAREIADKGYPTVSGRGTWRGAMVKNFFEKMASG